MNLLVLLIMVSREVPVVAIPPIFASAVTWRSLALVGQGSADIGRFFIDDKNVRMQHVFSVVSSFFGNTYSRINDFAPFMQSDETSKDIVEEFRKTFNNVAGRLEGITYDNQYNSIVNIRMKKLLHLFFDVLEYKTHHSLLQFITECNRTDPYHLFLEFADSLQLHKEHNLITNSLEADPWHREETVVRAMMNADDVLYALAELHVAHHGMKSPNVTDLSIWLLDEEKDPFAKRLNQTVNILEQLVNEARNKPVPLEKVQRIVSTTINAYFFSDSQTQLRMLNKKFTRIYSNTMFYIIQASNSDSCFSSDHVNILEQFGQSSINGLKYWVATTKKSSVEEKLKLLNKYEKELEQEIIKLNGTSCQPDMFKNIPNIHIHAVDLPAKINLITEAEMQHPIEKARKILVCIHEYESPVTWHIFILI